MRRVRALFVLAVVVALSMPVAAAPRQKDRTPRVKENPIVKIIRQIAVRTFGDGLTDPKP